MARIQMMTPFPPISEVGEKENAYGVICEVKVDEHGNKILVGEIEDEEILDNFLDCGRARLLELTEEEVEAEMKRLQGK